jgi:outer membrane protein, heavy metal efflux system
MEMTTLFGVRRSLRAGIARVFALTLLLPALSVARGQGPAQTDGQPVARRTESIELVRRAIETHAGLAASRLDVERARARLRQAGLRPNPTLDFEKTTGRFTGADGEGETSVGVSVPLELFGQRGRRIDVAEVELSAAEAEIADRERLLAADVRARYADALAARRELEVTDEINEIDESMARFVEIRVSEGESAPLELELLRVEIDRARSRRAVVEGKYEAALIDLRSLAGIAPSEPVNLAEKVTALAWVDAPRSASEAIEIALRMRPDLRLSRIEERVAEAGLRLARAQSSPEVTAFSRFSVETAIFDDTPVGVLRDRDKTLSFGVSISLPVFNRNQGAKAEAETAIVQSRKQREYAEQRVRAEVESAYARFRAAESAVTTFEKGVIARSNATLRSVRGAYEIGAFSITELLAEQHRFSDAQQEYIETLADRYRALADLQTAMGVIEPFTERTPAAQPAVAVDAAGKYPGLSAPAAETGLPDLRNE